jgi:hypothetical protein
MKVLNVINNDWDFYLEFEEFELMLYIICVILEYQHCFI